MAFRNFFTLFALKVSPHFQNFLIVIKPSQSLIGLLRDWPSFQRSSSCLVCPIKLALRFRESLRGKFRFFGHSSVPCSKLSTNLKIPLETSWFSPCVQAHIHSHRYTSLSWIGDWNFSSCSLWSFASLLCHEQCFRSQYLWEGLVIQLLLALEQPHWLP